ncbi:D-alanyl-D-alanine carboxypeptidase family protein [Bombilactobacillus bombi]|uniref:D-alanyl-D-alanine carboxypeptidase family protein n=1 Tax=Bombilactobacillus bombi TaxID=1303590 RepID=UPI0015E5FAEA|nr:serine hydrolase [Bombilactobacillus bombi]
MVNNDADLQKGEYWVRQGQLQRAQPYLNNSRQPRAHKYAQQIMNLKLAQQYFNQGQFQKSQHQAQHVRSQLPTLIQIHKTARQLVKISQQAQQQHFVGPTIPNTLAQMDAKVICRQVTAGILIDQASGQVLWQKQSQQVLPVASLSKLLAVYTIYRTLEIKHISLQTPIPATAVITGIEKKPGLSTAKLEVGQYYSIQQLLQATMVASANDAIMVLGQYLYGSQERFVEMMQQNARNLKLHSVQLVNANGLPATLDPSVANNAHAKVLENHFNAQDLAKITQNLLQQFPQVLQLTKQQHIRIGAHNFVNTNEMLAQGKYSAVKYQVDGLKTGTGEAAGYGTVITTTIAKRRVILVVLKAPSDAARFLQARELLDYLADNWQVQTKTLATFPKPTKVTLWQAQNAKTKLRLQYQINLLKTPPQLDYSIWSNQSQIPWLFN